MHNSLLRIFNAGWVSRIPIPPAPTSPSLPICRQLSCLCSRRHVLITRTKLIHPRGFLCYSAKITLSVFVFLQLSLNFNWAVQTARITLSLKDLHVFLAEGGVADPTFHTSLVNTITINAQMISEKFIDLKFCNEIILKSYWFPSPSP